MPAIGRWRLVVAFFEMPSYLATAVAGRSQTIAKSHWRSSSRMSSSFIADIRASVPKTNRTGYRP